MDEEGGEQVAEVTGEQRLVAGRHFGHDVDGAFETGVGLAEAFVRERHLSPKREAPYLSVCCLTCYGRVLRPFHWLA